MKTKSLIYMFIMVATVLSCGKTKMDYSKSVNAIIGDVSFIEKFGFAPDENTDENLRIRTHLEYVENMLRGRDISSWSEERKQSRARMLDYLNDYWTNGQFPNNYDHSERRPCFIDVDGNICAVGYLVEQSAGRENADYINGKYKYEYLLAMNDPKIDKWIESSGLTPEECAMIQPQYWPSPQSPNYNHISDGYAISSSVLGGLNLSLNAINGIQIANGNYNNNTVAAVGLMTGISQFTLGVVSFPEEKGSQTNHSKRTLSMVNIGLGTTTMILSTWNLMRNRSPSSKLSNWNIYSVPDGTKNIGVGLAFSKRF
jgi:hypothetical protein